MKPHLSKEAVEQAASEIYLMPFFPSSDIQARAMLMRYFFDLCHTDEQVIWLGKRYVTLFPKWAGLRELRAVASAKFKPRDGIEVYSETYIDGIPSEKIVPTVMLPASRSEPRQLTESPEMRQLVQDLALATTMPEPRRPRTISEIEAEIYKRHPVKGA